MMFLRLRKMPRMPDREQDRADRKIMSKTDRHCTHSGASASCRPCPDATLRTLIASSGVRAFCTLMSCRLTLALWRKRQHDGADHRDQQHHAGDLEVVNVFGIEHEAERLGVADIGRDRAR